ncbi:hypothetical protein COLO4_09391 [Corchorus olitorius]|uniref:Uncharacterized protein n=1 Tax=Corchorus olitorius TaxID=93759 RepID=A0A1R3KC59_9ROSI|nr:hypothetical protein COLO4_09391 [Corchorus olitorius]
MKSLKSSVLRRDQNKRSKQASCQERHTWETLKNKSL